MPDCHAIPLEGEHHTGPVRSYIRVCPAGHFRPGTVCEACAGNGAIICDDCDGPALVILMDIWAALIARGAQ
jgi:DnaJ-class molecular chaperone